MGTMLAMCLLGVILVIGMALDYASMTNKSSSLQNYSDAAALAAAISGEEKQSVLHKIAGETIAANNHDKSKITHKVKLVDGAIRVEASANYKPAIMGMFGYKSTPVSVVSVVPLPEDASANIALVLDRTASMREAGNLPPLKKAAGGMIEALKDSDGTIRMSIVPFSDYVNVGTYNRHQSWVDVPPDSRRKEEVCRMKRDVKRKYDCKWAWRTRTVDGVKKKQRYKKCKYEYGKPYKSCQKKWVGEKWYGCMGSRNPPYNLKPEFGSMAIKGIMNRSCGQTVLPLTDNLALAKRKVDSLTGSGQTYMPSGLIWGWRTLNPQTPYTEASKGSKNAIRALVLMTDGQNTVYQRDEYHKTTSNAARLLETETRTLALCDGIKRDGITVYTVAYNLPGGAASAKTTLKTCASDGAKFYDAKNASQLKKAFEDIGSDFKQIRISH